MRCTMIVLTDDEEFSSVVHKAVRGNENVKECLIGNDLPGALEAIESSDGYYFVIVDWRLLDQFQALEDFLGQLDDVGERVFAASVIPSSYFNLLDPASRVFRNCLIDPVTAIVLDAVVRLGMLKLANSESARQSGMQRGRPSELPPSTEGSVLRALVLDDEPAVLRIIDRVLKGACEVVTFEHGSDALEYLTEHEVDLIISDCDMPGMMGSDFLGRAMKIRPETYRVVMSGGSPDLARDAIARGLAHMFLAKPWEKGEIVQIIQSARQHRFAGNPAKR